MQIMNEIVYFLDICSNRSVVSRFSFTRHHVSLRLTAIMGTWLNIGTRVVSAVSIFFASCYG